MTVVSLLYVLALISYLALAVRLLAKKPRTTLSWSCAIVLFGLAVWSIEDIVHGIPAAPLPLVRLFGDIGSFGWGTFASLNFAFMLVFARQQRMLRKWFLSVPLVALPVLTIYEQMTGNINASYALGEYGWQTVWSRSVWPTVFYVYYLSFTLLALLLVFRFRRRAVRSYERKQAGVILGTGVVSLALGTVSDVILPQFTRLQTPDVAGALVLIWAAGIYYAVTRYGLMSVTPQAAADDILATMPDALLLLGPDGRLARANQAALDLFGYQAGELAGRHAGLLFAEPAKCQTALTRIASGEPVSALELDCRTHDGRVVPVSISGRVMRDRGGETIGIVLVLRDITERRRAEAALVQAQAELLRHEKLATLGRVAGSVAHEIRNPLGAIRNAAYFLKLTVSDKLEGKAARHLQVINDETTHANQIIASLLDFAQGRLCEPRPCRLTGILSRATTRAELPRITEVETRLPDNLPEVLVDPDQIEQVFVNLITNAHQAMPSGGRITIAATRTNGHVRVRVSDTGAGIAPEHMKRLFEPLFSTKTFGVGLGLAICKSFIEANKGTVEVESEPGKGTTATVTLPVAAASEVRDPGP